MSPGTRIQRSADGRLFVSVDYTSQTLEQMREALPLFIANPPAHAPVFVPGCSGPDLSCAWEDFAASVQRAIDPSCLSRKR
jgi:4-phytase/acid phosphatase